MPILFGYHVVKCSSSAYTLSYATLCSIDVPLYFEAHWPYDPNIAISQHVKSITKLYIHNITVLVPMLLCIYVPTLEIGKYVMFSLN